MNRVVLSALLIAVSSLAYSQNKSLGVGTSTPNPNAALHVESPTGNQGAIMPRLSTAQRTAMAGILGVADAGLLLYDNDLKGLYIWDGAAWQSSAKLQFPVVDTINSIPPNGNALRIVYNGTDVGNFGVAHFENLNPNSGFSAIFGRTNSVTNGVADFIVSNPANTNDAIGVNTNALNGRAGAFNLNNPGSRNFALYAQSNGDSTGAAVHGNNLGNGFGVYGRSVGSKFASAAVYGLHEGTGDAAGAFRINNAGNPYSALYGETNGNGSAIFGNNLGPVGRAGQFQIGNAGNPAAALRGFTSGLGNAAFFTIGNLANDSSSLYATTNGIGSAGNFETTNLTNNSPALQVKSNSTTAGSAAFSGKMTGSGGPAGYFEITNVSNTYSALYGFTNGLNGAGYFQNTNPANNFSTLSGLTNGIGPAGYFQNTNTANTNSTLYSVSNGTSNAIALRAELTNASNTGAGVYGSTVGSGVGVYGITTGTGAAIQGYTTTGSTAIYGTRDGATNGNAGRFDIINAGNSFPSLQANTIGTGSAGNFTINNSTNAAAGVFVTSNGTGAAISANQSNGGLALEILSGGIKFPVTQLSGDDIIPDNAVVVELTGATQLISLPSGGQDGQAIYVVNTGAGSSIVAGTNLDPDRGIMFIRLSGNWRAIVLSLP